MKFKMNNIEWEIKEISQKEMKESQNKRNNNSDEDVNNTSTRYYGLTYHDDLMIYLDKDLPFERKRRTLMHELTHCYLDMYIFHGEVKYYEEDICDISANSHDIIHDIVERYFKNENIK